MGAFGECCCGGCVNSECPDVFPKFELSIGGNNPTVIEHQFITDTKVRRRALPDITTITLAGTPVIGDVIRVNTTPILTVASTNIADILAALANALNDGPYFFNNASNPFGSLPFDALSFPFVVASASEISSRGDESITVPGFGTLPTGYPCQPGQLNVVNQPGSTLTATIAFAADSSPPYLDENVQGLYIGWDLASGTYTFQFDHGSLAVPYVRPSPATVANLLAARDTHISNIIQGIRENDLVDCSIDIEPAGSWIRFTSPDQVDTKLTPIFGIPISNAQDPLISQLQFANTGFGATSAGSCCHATLTAKPVALTIEDPFESLLHIDDKLAQEEWIYSFERTETFTAGGVFSSILSPPCPLPGQSQNDPCTFTDPITVSLFYSHRVRRFIDDIQATLCVVDVSGVPSLRLRLRIAARWRVTRKILSSDQPGYNTTPLVSLSHNSIATESGTGITHNVFGDVFDQTVTVPLGCPVPDFVFTPTNTDQVLTQLSMGAIERDICCQVSLFFDQNLYQPLLNSPITFRFKKCELPP